MNKFLFLSISILCLIFSACNDDGIRLAYNMQKGDVFVQEMQTETRFSQVFFGRDMEALTLLNLRTKYEVVDVRKNQIMLDFTYQNIKLYMDMGFSKIMLDSETTDSISTLTAMNPILKAMIGIPVRVTMDKTGKVKEIHGEEKLLEAMLNSFANDIDFERKKEVVEQFEPQFGKQNLRMSIEQTMAVLPSKKVAVGDTWTNKLKLNVSQDVDINANFKLIGIEEDIAVIECEGDFLFENPNEIIENTLIKMSGTQKGIIQVDIHTGRTLLAEIKQDVENELAFAGTVLPQTIVTKTIVVEHE